MLRCVKILAKEHMYKLLQNELKCQKALPKDAVAKAKAKTKPGKQTGESHEHERQGADEEAAPEAKAKAKENLKLKAGLRKPSSERIGSSMGFLCLYSARAFWGSSRTAFRP